jgi:methylated-DNA-protein-cysteine methyltransferase related protein
MKKNNKIQGIRNKEQEIRNKKQVSKEDKLAIKGEGKEYSFFEDVYNVVRQIPRGKVTSYGAIAAYLGTKLSARMVGWAMNAAGRTKPKVPAQRVVNRNGMLTGKHHFATETLMEELLKKDGVAVENDTVIGFKTRFWDPLEELSL